MKFPLKLVSIFAVFLLLSTVGTTITSANNLGKNFKEIIENSKSSNNLIKTLVKGNSLRENLKQIINDFKNKKQNIIDKLSNDNNEIIEPTTDNDISKTSVIKSKNTISILKTIQQFSNEESLFFYTNYNGIEKKTPLKLFGTSKINVDNDAENKDDIKVKFSLGFSIEKPLCFALKFKFKVTRLSAFPDKNADFKAYCELYFPGLVFDNLTGDRVRYGYESETGDEVPEDCEVTYKFLPHLFYPHRKIGHQASINPGTIAGKSKLSLLYGYSDFDNETLVADNNFKIVYKPAVKSEISISGTRNIGSSSFSFEKISSGASQIDMYFSHMRDGNYTNLYAIGVPEHLTFSIQRGRDGYVDFDTYGNAVDEIGFYDGLTPPKNRIYASGAPTKLLLKWSRHLITQSKASVSILAEGEGLSLGGNLTGPNNGILEFSVLSIKNINCSVGLDLNEGYFILERSEMDLSLLLNIRGYNGTTFDGSMKVKRLVDGPFKITFKDLLKGKGELTGLIAGKHIDISNLIFDLYSPDLKGNFVVKMDRFTKDKNGSLSSSFLIDSNPGNFTARCRFDIIQGVNISNLSISYNSFKIQPGDINVLGNKTLWFNFTLKGSVEVDIAPDFSWGYICIKGSLIFNINSIFERNGILGGVQGSFIIETPGIGFDFSWITVEGSKVFNINGGSIVSLENFHLWYGDIIDVSISRFYGSFILTDASSESGSLLLEIKGDGSTIEFMDFSFDSNEYFNPENFTFNISMENIKMGGKIDASIELLWSNYNITNIIVDVAVGVELSIDNLMIDFKMDNNSFRFVSDKFVVSGLLEIVFDVLHISEVLVEGPLCIIMTDAKIDLHIKNLDLSDSIGFDLDDITIDAETNDTASICFENISIEEKKEINGVTTEEMGADQNMTFINITVAINTNNGDLNLKLLEIGNVTGIVELIFQLGIGIKITLRIENLSFTNGVSIITIPILYWSYFSQKAGKQKGALIGLGIFFDNKFTTPGDYTLTIDKMSLIVPEILFGMVTDLIGIPSNGYANSTFTIFIENIALKQGFFKFYLEMMMDGMKIEIADASGLDNVDIRAGFPGTAYALLSLEDPFEYLLVDYNAGFNNLSDLENDDVNKTHVYTYLIIDTQNKTIPADIEIWVEEEFINEAAVLIEENSDIELPRVKSDIGLKLESVIFQADNFKISDFKDNINQTSTKELTGYLYIEAGQIWLYKDSSWMMIGDGNISITIEEGHAQLYIDEYLTIPEYEYITPNGTHFSIGGTFAANNCYLDIWWNLTTGNLSFTCSASFEMHDFYLDISKNDFIFISCSVELFSIQASVGLDNPINFKSQSNETMWFEIDACVDELKIKDFKVSKTYVVNKTIEPIFDEPSDEDIEKNYNVINISSNVTVDGEFDLSASGDLYIVTDLDNTLSIQSANPISLEVANVSLKITSKNTPQNFTDPEHTKFIERTLFELTCRKFKIEGYGVISFIGGQENMELDASITLVEVDDLYIFATREFLDSLSLGMGLQFSGTIDAAAAGAIVIQSILNPHTPDPEDYGNAIDIIAVGVLRIRDFKLHIFTNLIPIGISGELVQIEGSGIVSMHPHYTAVNGGIDRLKVKDCHVYIPRVNVSSALYDLIMAIYEKTGEFYYFDIKVDFDIDIYAQGIRLYYYDDTCTTTFAIVGQGRVVIKNLDADLIIKQKRQENFAEDICTITVKCDYLEIEAFMKLVEQAFKIQYQAGQYPGPGSLSYGIGPPPNPDFVKFLLEIKHLYILGFSVHIQGDAGYMFTIHEANIDASIDAAAYIFYQKDYHGQFLQVGAVLVDGIITGSFHITGPGHDVKLGYIELSGRGSASVAVEKQGDNPSKLKCSAFATDINFIINDFEVTPLEDDDVDDVEHPIIIILSDFDMSFTGGSFHLIAFAQKGETGSLMDNLYFDTGLTGDCYIGLDSLDLYMEGSSASVQFKVTNFVVVGEANFNLHLDSQNPKVYLETGSATLSVDKFEMIGSQGRSIIVEDFSLDKGKMYIELLYDSLPTTLQGFLTELKGFRFGINGTFGFSIGKIEIFGVTVPIFDIDFPSLIGNALFTVRWYGDGGLSDADRIEISGICSETVKFSGIDFSGFMQQLTFSFLNIELKPGSFFISIVADQPFTGNGFFSIFGETSSEFSISAVEISSNNYDISAEIAKLTMFNGSFTFDISSTQWSLSGPKKGILRINASTSSPPQFNGFVLNIGEYSIALPINIEINFPYLEIFWELNQNEDSFDGKIGIDTNNQDVGLTFSVLDVNDNNIIKFDMVGLKAQDFVIQWNWTRLVDILLCTNISGTISFTLFEITIPINGVDTVMPLALSGIPEAFFVFYPDSPLPDEEITFDATGSTPSTPDGRIDQMYWVWGDGWYSGWIPYGDGIKTHQYDQPGTYEVTLKVKDNELIPSTLYSRNVTVINPGSPIPTFIWSPNQPNAGDVVTFDASDSHYPNGDPISRYEWDFDDGGPHVVSYDDPYVTHVFDEEGEYDVTLTVDNTNSKTKTVTVEDGVNDPPIARFTWDPEYPKCGIYNGDNVEFDASSSYDEEGDELTYTWDFGDGTSVVETLNPITYHMFPSMGEKNVQLTLTDEHGGSDTISHTVYVQAGGTANTPPEAYVYARGWETQSWTGGYIGSTYYGDSTLNGETNRVYVFSAYPPPVQSGEDTKDPDGILVEYSWIVQSLGTYSDDLSAENQDIPDTNEISLFQNGPYDYIQWSTPGTYMIRLSVEDDDGEVATATLYMNIEASSGYNIPPIAQANGPYAGDIDESISFSSLGSNDPDGDNSQMSYYWDFDDEGFSEAANPTHSYSEGGVYTVTLTVTDENDATHTDTSIVRIYTAPVATFTVSPSHPKVLQTITFDASGSYDPDGGNIVKYEWHIQNNVYFTKTAQTTFLVAGWHSVTLIVTDDEGVETGYTKSIRIYAI